MEDVTRDELGGLARWMETPTVTIYQPLHRALAGLRTDEIVLRHLTDRAGEMLREAGMAARAAKSVLEPLGNSQRDEAFWGQGEADGLAVFLAPGFYRRYHLPYACAASVDVGESFYLGPLARAVGRDESYYLLALSENRVQLYRCTRRETVPVEMPAGTPQSLGQTLEGTEADKSLQCHTTAAPARGRRETVIMHGQGTPKDDQKTRLKEYLRAVARKLDEFLDGERLPLVIAAADYYHPMFAKACRYSNLVAAGVSGSPDKLTAAELRQRAEPIILPLLDRQTRNALARYRDMPLTRTKQDLTQIVRLAREGRVELLFTVEGERVWGRFDKQTGEVAVHESRQPGDTDLVNMAAQQTLNHRGELHVVGRGELSHDGPVAALLRW